MFTTRFIKVAAVLAVLGWLTAAFISVIADGGQPQLVRSVSAVFSGGNEEEKVALPPQWADNMVLQRDVPIPISGKAEPGREVSIIFGDRTKAATADGNGNWQATLDPLPPSAEPRDLRIIPGCIKCSKEIRNVLVGDVWLCGGAGSFPGPMAGGGDESALHRDFARALQTELSVPIGLIDCGSSPAADPADAEGMFPPTISALKIPFPIRGVLWSIDAPRQKMAVSELAAQVQGWRKRSGQADAAVLLFAENSSAASQELQRDMSAQPRSRFVVIEGKNPGEAGARLAAEALRMGAGSPGASAQIDGHDLRGKNVDLRGMSVNQWKKGSASGGVSVNDTRP